MGQVNAWQIGTTPLSLSLPLLLGHFPLREWLNSPMPLPISLARDRGRAKFVIKLRAACITLARLRAKTELEMYTCIYHAYIRASVFLALFCYPDARSLLSITFVTGIRPRYRGKSERW